MTAEAKELAVVPVDDGGRELAPMPDVPVGVILNNAVRAGSSIETLERLVALHRQVKADEARQAFYAAMAAFKEECPQIPRRTPNNQFKSVDRNGVSGPRMYASLEDIGRVVIPIMSRHGLSHRWGESELFDRTVGDKTVRMMRVSCIVSHVGGHEVPTPAEIQVDSNAGCSEQQKYGSAFTYAQRYSLIQALGLTTCDEDDDGNVPASGDKLNEDQADKLDTLLNEVCPDSASRGRFLGIYGVASVADIPAAMFGAACKVAEQKRRKA